MLWTQEKVKKALEKNAVWASLEVMFFRNLLVINIAFDCSKVQILDFQLG